MRDEIKKYKEEYYQIGFVVCCAIGDKKVFINSYGFKHLIRKGRIPRSKKERQNRLALIIHIQEALQNGVLIEIRKEYKGNVKMITFWCIEYYIQTKNIRVILRRIKNGKIHFFSIYSK